MVHSPLETSARKRDLNFPWEIYEGSLCNRAAKRKFVEKMKNEK